MPAHPPFLTSTIVISLVFPPLSWAAEKTTKATSSATTKARKGKATSKPAVPVAAWEAMQGQNVAATLLDGSISSGRLAGLKGNVATLVDADGVVHTVDIVDVAELREERVAPPPPSPPPPAAVPQAPQPANTLKKGSRRAEREHLAALHRLHGKQYTGPKGTPMYVTGIAMSTFGVLAMVLGGAGFGLGLARDDPYDDSQPGLVPAGKGLLVVGILSFAVGLPLMIVGERRRDRYHAWLKQQSFPQASRPGRVTLSPTLGPLRGGWGAGIRVGF